MEFYQPGDMYDISLFSFSLIKTSGFATTHVVVSVRHPIIYQSPHTLPTSRIRQIKLTARIASIHAIF